MDALVFEGHVQGPHRTHRRGGREFGESVNDIEYQLFDLIPVFPYLSYRRPVDTLFQIVFCFGIHADGKQRLVTLIDTLRKTAPHFQLVDVTTSVLAEVKDDGLTQGVRGFLKVGFFPDTSFPHFVQFPGIPAIGAQIRTVESVQFQRANALQRRSGGDHGASIENWKYNLHKSNFNRSN